MRHKLFLDIYTFQLKEILSIEQSNGKRRKIKTKDEICDFSSFYTKVVTHDSKNKKPVEIIFEKLLRYFDDSFRFSKTGTKAVSITSDRNSVSNENCTISGVFKGGITGIKRNVYYGSDSRKYKTEIEETDVTADEYFFMLWIPKDSNAGFLFVQSYKDISCSIPFRDCVSEFFIKENYKPLWIKFILKSYVNDIMKYGLLNKIKIVKAEKTNKKLADSDFEPFKECRQTCIIDNISFPLRKLLLNLNQLKTGIGGIVSDYNAEEDSVTLFYKDHKGNNVQATFEDLEAIVPKMELDESLLNNGQPNWEGIRSSVVEILKQIKQEIGYTPKEIT